MGAIAASRAAASDHADPIDLFNKERLEGGITDLFVFPVLSDDQPAFPFQRPAQISLTDPLTAGAREPLTAEQLAQIDSIVVVLCVRRALTQSGSLRLEPYTYRIHMDLHSPVEVTPPKEAAAPEHADMAPSGGGYHQHAGSNAGRQRRPTLAEAIARYGGMIQRPADIANDMVIEFRLDNEAQLQDGYPTYSGPLAASLNDNRDRIQITSGVFDDPFIFPAFFGTNVVAMVIRIPSDLFPADRTDFLIWATSHEGHRQVDHVGRSLRTQNPRFELLNTLAPRDHVSAIQAEHEQPSLMRNLFLRANLQSPFAYREWDFVPDVMVFTTQYPVGFPNGRLLTDDVAALLAQHGDTLLYELSHHNASWPRRNTNDREFRDRFPYLADPWPDRMPNPPLRLSATNRLKLVGIALALVALLLLENWLVVLWFCRRKLRRRTVL